MTLRLFMTTDTVGGVWRYSTELAAALAAEGVHVALGIVGPPPSPEQRAGATASGVEVLFTGAPLDWLAGSPSSVARARAAVATAAGAWGADLLQINQPAYAAGAHPAPVVAVAHSCVETWWRGTHGTSAPQEWAWHRQAVSEGLRAAAIAVAPSAAFGDALRRAYRLPETPLTVPNGLSRTVEPASKQRFVLAAGRAWDESKNFGLLDAAAPGIAWPVRLAGSLTAPDGGDTPALSNVQCLGHLGRDEMERRFAEAPIFVAPSLYEPFGLGVLEAAQAGAALVLSDIPTFREIWDGAARFFPPRDPAALADTVNTLARDDAMRRRLANAARQRATLFTVAGTARRMLSIYGGIAWQRGGAEVPL